MSYFTFELKGCSNTCKTQQVLPGAVGAEKEGEAYKQAAAQLSWCLCDNLCHSKSVMQWRTSVDHTESCLPGDQHAFMCQETKNEARMPFFWILITYCMHDARSTYHGRGSSKQHWVVQQKRITSPDAV